MNHSLMSLGHLLPPEIAHRAALNALKLGLFKSRNPQKARLAQEFFGLQFNNPIGVAAGFDKDAEVPLDVMNAGFGFTEVGTLTPLPQPGNPKPRIFRLKEHQALINRFGFNSQGHDAAYERLTKIKERSGPIGINIGANKTSEDFVDDYEQGILKFAGLADYFTVNISSPNTPGLRDLQYGEALKTLVNRIAKARDTAFEKHQKRPPVFLKIAPDLDDAMLDTIVEAFEISGFEGLIVSNTTLERSAVKHHKFGHEAGGLSGRPLAHASTIMLAKVRQRVGRDILLIGVGGIHNTQTALDKIKAGANLIQLYSALTFQGFGLANTINDGLDSYLGQSEYDHISALMGIETDIWAAKE